MVIFKRIPSWKQIAPVYAMIVLIIYTWTIMWFFWKLPSWLFFLNAGEIINVFAYIMATNFVESLIVLCAPILLCIVLPNKWFHDSFIARGVSLIMFGLAGMIYLAFQVQAKIDHPTFSFRLSYLAFGILIVLLGAFGVSSIRLLRTSIEMIAERATIFLYVSIPISVLSLFLVVFHWVF